MFTSYEGNLTVLLYLNYLKMFKTLRFCFVEDNKIISSTVGKNTNMEPDKKD